MNRQKSVVVSIVLMLTGTLPLAMLTASSWKDLVISPVRGDSWNPGDWSQELALTSAAVQDVKRSEFFIKQVTDSDWATSQSSGAPQMSTLTGTLLKAQEKMDILAKAREVIKEMPSCNSEKPDQEAEAWHRFRERKRTLIAGLNDQGKLQDAIDSHIKARRTDFETLETARQMRALVDNALAEADKELGKGRFTECLEWLRDLPAGGFDDDRRVKMDMVRRRAEFGQIQRMSKAEEKLIRLRALVSSFRLRPANTEKDLDIQCQRMIRDLEAQIIVDRVRQRGPDTVRELLPHLQSAMEKNPSELVRKELASTLTGWLERQLPLKETKEFDGMQEAQLKRSGLILVGVFDRVNGSGGTWYDYWKTKADRENRLRANLASLTEGEFKMPPRRWTLLICADDFNMQRRQLALRWHSRREWEKTGELCRNLQRQVDEIEAKRRSDVRFNLSFKLEAEFCDEALNRDWALLETALRP